MKSLLPALFFLLSLFLGRAESVLAKPAKSHAHESVTSYPQKNTPTTGKLTREEQVLLQIYLDELSFTPGVIDGALGRFSKLALSSFYTAIGLPEDTSPRVALEYALEHKTEPYVTAKVPILAKKHIDHKLPYKYSELAEHKKAHYRSYAEFMAERYHTSVKFLTTLNGKTAINNLTTGKELIVPNVRPFYIEDLKNRRFKEEESINRNFAIVNTKQNVMRIYRKETSGSVSLVAFFPITPGRKDQLRFGEWEMVNSVTYPTWRYDPKVLDGTGRSSDDEAIEVPPGPNNPVGLIWNGLSAKSVGIHGTNNPETIGRSTSSGCIRMANWDVVKIPNFLRPGCKVTIK